LFLWTSGLARSIAAKLRRICGEPGRCEDELESTATARNLAALGNVIENGDEPSRPLILACSCRSTSRGDRERRRSPAADVSGILRERGFSRADTDHMRLLLEAATHMRMRTRWRAASYGVLTIRRPSFFELIAPTYNVESRRSIDSSPKLATSRRAIATTLPRSTLVTPVAN